PVSALCARALPNYGIGGNVPGFGLTGAECIFTLRTVRAAPVQRRRLSPHPESSQRENPARWACAPVERSQARSPTV
ncbi:MAG: hypothetical protein N3G20_03140, partial [Verrucomicrobiae bacterium]|nr:hypothetical protein [Verrucomicrobiae bacterium]